MPEINAPPPLMNPSNRPAPSSAKAWILVLGFIFFLGLTFLGVGIYAITSFIRLGSDERALRNDLLRAAAVPWQKQGEVNVGFCTTSLARVGLSFANLPPEAQTAVNCVRAGQVGVYHFQEPPSRADRAAMFTAADKTMSKRGWERLVGVLDPENLVAVYVPSEFTSTRNIKVCVAVIDDERLFIASVRGDLEPLIHLMSKHPEWHWKKAPPELRTVFK
jgi:hypothetical protein